LSQGGTVVAPLEKTFYTEAIGEVIDKFGARWEIMVTDEDYKD
jgi:PhnB protein